MTTADSPGHNLRTDALKFARDNLPGDYTGAAGYCRSLIERLSAQVDQVEEYWHAAERRAQQAERIAAWWSWLPTNGCGVVEDSAIRADKWLVVDVDNEIVARGTSPLEAVMRGIIRVEGVSRAKAVYGLELEAAPAGE